MVTMKKMLCNIKLLPPSKLELQYEFPEQKSNSPIVKHIIYR